MGKRTQLNAFAFLSKQQLLAISNRKGVEKEGKEGRKGKKRRGGREKRQKKKRQESPLAM